jgi:hypothetical protein
MTRHVLVLSFLSVFFPTICIASPIQISCSSTTPYADSRTDPTFDIVIDVDKNEATKYRPNSTAQKYIFFNATPEKVILKEPYSVVNIELLKKTLFMLEKIESTQGYLSGEQRNPRRQLHLSSSDNYT